MRPFSPFARICGALAFRMNRKHGRAGPTLEPKAPFMARKKKKTPIDIPLDALMAGLKPGQKLLGLDLGTKTIGLAISDSGRMIASPLETISRKKFTQDAERLLTICTEQSVGGFVLGMPLNMDGSEGPRAQATRDFYMSLRDLWREREQKPIPVTFWDERLSTVAVTRTLLDADTSRARRDEVVDKMAASFILQGALDRARFAKAEEVETNEGRLESD